MRFTHTANKVREELRSISGAIRDEPQHRESGGGQEPRVLVPLYDPAPGTGALELGSEVDLPDGIASDTEADPAGEFTDGVMADAARAELAEAIAAGGAQNDRRIREQVVLEGVDALGWYVTLHQDAFQWGICIKAEEALWLARTVYLPIANSPVLAVRLAIRAIHDHELMHFAEDWAIAQVELIRDSPIWWPSRSSAEIAQVRKSAERLANGYMLRRARCVPQNLRCAGAYSALGKWTLTQGEGYKDGLQLVGTQLKFDQACQEHAAEVVRLSKLNPGVKRSDLHRLYALAPHVDWRFCPVRIVAEDANYAALLSSLFIQQIQHIEETDRFASMLRGRPLPERTAWKKVRGQLAQSTRLKGLDFKPWPPRGSGWYSVRVSRSGRAHIRFESTTQRWFAEEIGQHSELGHG